MCSDRDATIVELWGLFDNDGNPMFDNDEDAADFVRAMGLSDNPERGC